MRTQWHQRQLISLKIGDKAYWVQGTYGIPEVITITGDCEEGDGYTAHSPRYAIEYPNLDPNDPEHVPGAIHTCNGFLCKTKKEARAESLRIVKALRVEYARQQAWYNKNIQYLDWVIVNRGKHP